MATLTRRGHLDVVATARREPAVPSSLLGMLVFIASEAMFFAGLISAFTIVRSGAPVWPPPGQPRLPIEETAFNTAALIASAVLLIFARRAFNRQRNTAAKPLLGAMALGTFFVVFQGIEWANLLSQGLTLTSSSLGGFFYLIVGIHALHAVAALALLSRTYLRLRRGWLASSQLAAAEAFWYFVVALWPILYLRVYL
jgi:cytochrome c oxidase subunit 3